MVQGPWLRCRRSSAKGALRGEGAARGPAPDAASQCAPSMRAKHRWLCRSPRSLPTVRRVGPAPGLVGRVVFALATLVVVAVALVPAGLRCANRARCCWGPKGASRGGRPSHPINAPPDWRAGRSHRGCRHVAVSARVAVSAGGGGGRHGQVGEQRARTTVASSFVDDRRLADHGFVRSHAVPAARAPARRRWLAAAPRRRAHCDAGGRSLPPGEVDLGDLRLAVATRRNGARPPRKIPGFR
jgi:hypothetical protein